MGIPTVDGGVWFHEGYVGNPLVYCGTVGLMPHWAAEKSVQAGDLILLVGGRTGRDGIHGATFSSAELHEESETLSGAAVQIGDAIAGKRVLAAPPIPVPGCPAPAAAGVDHARALLALLASPDIASKEWIVRQYDHEVQGMAVQKALVGARLDAPGDAAVLKPLADSPMGAAIACGASPRYGRLDPAAMALAAIDEALRNAVAVGGDPERTAILDNFSWGNCDKEDRLGSLVLAAQACKAAALAYGTPFISGKDSLNNEYRVGGGNRLIPPTLLISALAIVPDVARTASMDL